jgi:uncharacterized repeat protein (TIGR01451 family)
MRANPRLAPLLLLLLVAALFAGQASPAAAVTPAPGLTIHPFALPTNFSTTQNEACLAAEGAEEKVKACDVYQITVTNSGALASEGPLVVTDLLPAGLKAEALTTRLSAIKPSEEREAPKSCEVSATPLRCEFPIRLQPGQMLELTIAFIVEPSAVSGEENLTRAFEGGSETPSATVVSKDVVSSAVPPFGPSSFVAQSVGLDGKPETQAGGHPHEFTTRFDMNSVFRLGPETQLSEAMSVQDLRDVVVDLPIGFFGTAVATPKCTFAQLNSISSVQGGGCPLNTRLGHIISEPRALASINSGIYNMVPERGVAAEFGFTDVLNNSHVIVASLVPTPAGYVLRATSREISQVALADVVATFYGDPAEKDTELRQQEIEAEQRELGVEEPHVEREHANTRVGLFTNPSACTGAPLVTTAYMDSWQNPGSTSGDGTPNVEGPGWVKRSAESPPVTGCNRLRFVPEAFISRPETSTANAPTGLTFELKLPQDENPDTLATPPLRNASVTLPPGLTVNPSAASGLQACSEAQIGWLGRSLSDFTPEAPSCPDASKIGSVEISTPLLANQLVGSVYLAAQNENPFHTLLAGYIVVNDPATGTVVKIAGNLTPNQQTGQITGVFNENPQLPFSDLKLHFFGGPRGDLATPEACGSYTTTSVFSPWSAPSSGPDATPSDSFRIDTGCVSGFAPAFSAGTLSPQAAGFSPFTLTLSRNDNEEGPAGLTVTLPTGLLGKIAGVTECPEAQVAAAAVNGGRTEQLSPSCPSSSLLGTVTTLTGPGPSPFSVGGKAYLTGPYKGAPYGVAVVVPAVAGPFDLGTVVIRQALQIDPNDAHVTDVSDPFPTILQGIPLRIKSVSVTLDRPNFTLNPTSCEAKQVSATVTSTGGAHASVASRFQAAGCRSLPFAPKLTASAAGKASKANGTTFAVKVTSAGLGQSNIAKVRLQLPKALPSRLTTLQKACLAAVFEANPASCAETSVIGKATIHTPLLAGPLSGPAYLVSHGNAAFPDVEFVLQGEGVTLVLDGKTDIKKGITYSRFESTPDAPFTTFETVLPAGPHSILTANVPQSEKYSLCKSSLVMPTEITGQNGAIIRQSTKIALTGCSKTKALTRKQKLAAALKACKRKNKQKRKACQTQARKRFGAKKATNKH